MADVVENLNDKKQKILNIIRTRGPCLPAHLTSQTGLSILFAGAFLSELVADKKIKMSNMKVGGSPLYYLPGQEAMLEKFYTYLNSTEKEAFTLLKDKKILGDEKMPPRIRVALRAIKDFAIPFKSNDGRVFWRYYLFNETEARKLVSKKYKLEKSKKKEKIKEKIIEIKEQIIEKPQEVPILELPNTIEKQTQTIKVEKKSNPKRKAKEKSEFVKSIILFLQRRNLGILEEISFKKKEYEAKITVNTQIGKQQFLCIAKDKKRVTDNDFTLAHQKGNNMKLPVLFISPGEPNKKAQSWLENWKNLLIFQRV